jgi:hypothetical protein
MKKGIQPDSLSNTLVHYLQLDGGDGSYWQSDFARGGGRAGSTENGKPQVGGESICTTICTTICTCIPVQRSGGYLVPGLIPAPTLVHTQLLSEWEKCGGQGGGACRLYWANLWIVNHWLWRLKWHTYRINLSVAWFCDIPTSLLKQTFEAQVWSGGGEGVRDE